MFSKNNNIRLGIIGKSLPYTLSPQIHSLFMKDKGDLNYDIIEINNIDSLSKEKLLSYNGLNVTVPYKKEIIKLLDKLKDDAKYLNAVNTISKENNRLIGYNTDTYGFMQLLNYNKINPKDKNCIILGSGGACQAVYYVLKNLGANEIFIASRSPKGDNQISYDSLKEYKGYLIVNTTPVGTSPNIDKSPVDEDVIRNFDAVVDIVYNPSITKFLSYGIKNHKIVANGLYMLVSQAIKSQEYWQGIKYDKETVDSIYFSIKNSLNSKLNNNIYLIGMMGCGKSTIGKILANKIGYNFIDLDKIIEKKVNKSIPEIFKEGEECFRKIERECLSEVCINEKKSIVATGGGIIKNLNNILAMRTSGICIWLDRNIKLIEDHIDTSNRPLLQGKNQYVSTIYNERKDLYQYASDTIVINDKSLNSCVNDIIKTLDKVNL